MTPSLHKRDPGSFRDPSGFVYHDAAGVPHRQVHRDYLAAFNQFHDSGCYDALRGENLIVPHEVVSLDHAADPETAGAVIRPRKIPFISYPYEWSPGQLRDAALLTLRAQEIALDHGMTLRDASAYNVQFEGTIPVLIDTLSFGPHTEGSPWSGYRQYCMHFLAPLACRGDSIRALRVHLDGVPLREATRQLPWRARLSPDVLLHLVLHARAERRYADTASEPKKPNVSNAALRGTLQSLRRAVKRLHAPTRASHWSSYYGDNSYTDAATHAKDTIVREALNKLKPADVWDLGTNTGRYARMAAETGAHTVAFDSDPACIETMHKQDSGNALLLPLCMDLANPSPALGWAHAERKSLLDRGPADLALALALVHHLAISNNVPLPMVAHFLHRCAPRVLVEWVPKSDPMVQRLLASREDIFDTYTGEHFVAAMEEYFTVAARTPLPDSGRILFQLEARA